MQASDWRDIATAPKDGRNVLLCVLNELGERYYVECWWDYSVWMTAIDTKEMHYTPTHWMPTVGPKEGANAD